MKNHLIIGGKLHEIETPASVYTREDWEFDKTFAAMIGQEVSEDVYDQFYDCMPPLSLHGGALAAELGIVGGFRVGEPYAHAKSTKTGEYTPFYAAFGRTAAGKFYFLGNQNKYGEIFESATGGVIANA